MISRSVEQTPAWRTRSSVSPSVADGSGWRGRSERDWSKTRARTGERYTRCPRGVTGAAKAPAPGVKAESHTGRDHTVACGKLSPGDPPATRILPASTPITGALRGAGNGADAVQWRIA